MKESSAKVYRYSISNRMLSENMLFILLAIYHNIFCVSTSLSENAPMFAFVICIKISLFLRQ